MSVINRVLRDLEQRNAAGHDRLAVPSAVRAVAEPEPRPRRVRVAIAVLVVVLAVIVVAVLTAGTDPEPVRPASPAAASSEPTPSEPSGSAGGQPAQRVPADTVEVGGPRPAPSAPAPEPRTTAVRSSSGSTRAVPELKPVDSTEAAFREGALALQQGRVRDAEARFRRVLELVPDHQKARQALVGLLLESGRSDAAELAALEGAQRSPVHLPFVLVAARVQVERGEGARAIATLERFAGAGARNAEFLAFHADLLQRAGRHEAAVARFGEAISLGPPRAVWHMGRAISLRELGRLSEARAAFEKALASGALAAPLREYVERQLVTLGGTGPGG